MPTAVLRPATWRAPSTTSTRIGALDALRGLAIALMILVNNPGDREAMPSPFVHSAWHGYRVAEVVFPLFLFSVGASMAWSHRSGAPRPMLRRLLVLFILGCLLVSVKYRHLSASTGTLQLIAGASLMAWAARRWLSRRGQALYVGIVLITLWAGFSVTGWAPGTNLAARIDTAILGSPSDLGFVGIVSASTLVLAGSWIGTAVRTATTPWARAWIALRSGVVALCAGLVSAAAIPVNKRLWTPSYILVSFGLACLVLAVFMWWSGRRLSRTGLGPLETLGMNALAVYVVTSLAAVTVLLPVQDVGVPATAGRFGHATAAVAWAVGVLVLGYALCWGLRRRRLLIRL